MMMMMMMMMVIMRMMMMMKMMIMMDMMYMRYMMHVCMLWQLPWARRIGHWMVPSSGALTHIWSSERPQPQQQMM
eukprot:11857498-Karenia_brevis.AAC.1